MRIQAAEGGILPQSVNAAATAPSPAEARPQESRQPTAETQALSPKDAQALVEEMNKALKSINTGLEFSLQQDTGQMVVKVIDLETKETLRQFPSDEAIAVARALDKIKGVLLRQSA